jgi:hypothetical protein
MRDRLLVVDLPREAEILDHLPDFRGWGIGELAI